MGHLVLKGPVSKLVVAAGSRLGARAPGSMHAMAIGPQGAQGSPQCRAYRASLLWLIGILRDLIYHNPKSFWWYSICGGISSINSTLGSTVRVLVYTFALGTWTSG